MAGRLDGRTALVTGATSNIGRAIATAFAAEGAHVVVTGRDAERGAEVVGKIRAEGGRIDVLVNNAGIFPGSTTPDTDEATFDEVYAVNVKAPFFLTAEIAPAMAERGGGAIVNLGSWVARLGLPIGALYSSTKGAVETLTRAWAAEFGPGGVRVNAISPGVTRTPTPGDGGEHPAEIFMRGTPAGRGVTADAIAHAAVYLASDEAAFVHGTVLDVDGGRVAAAVVMSG